MDENDESMDQAEDSPLVEAETKDTAVVTSSSDEEEAEDPLPTTENGSSKMETFEIDQQNEGQEPNILQQISQDVDDLDEEAQGLLADRSSPPRPVGKVYCCCIGPTEQIGNCTVIFPVTFARTGWGIMGPHWFGPPCVAGVLLSASSFFIEHAYKRIGPITTGICILWTTGIIYLLINASFRDPGIVRQGQETPTKQHRWCEFCKNYQPPKGAHCPDCNVCVAGFDQ